jgi:hypothetical protein
MRAAASAMRARRLDKRRSSDVETIANTLKTVSGLAQKAGPYLLLEILLPGGTLFALLLFLYRTRGGSLAASARHTLIQVQPYDIAAVANSDAANDDGLGPLAMVPGR